MSACEKCPYFQVAQDKARSRAEEMLTQPLYKDALMVKAEVDCTAPGCGVAVQATMWRNLKNPTRYVCLHSKSCVYNPDK